MTKPPLPTNDMYAGQSDQIEYGDISSNTGDIHGDKPTTNHDPVFGEIREGGPNYRSVRHNIRECFRSAMLTSC